MLIKNPLTQWYEAVNMTQKWNYENQNEFSFDWQTKAKWSPEDQVIHHIFSFSWHIFSLWIFKTKNLLSRTVWYVLKKLSLTVSVPYPVYFMLCNSWNVSAQYNSVYFAHAMSAHKFRHTILMIRNHSIKSQKLLTKFMDVLYKKKGKKKKQNRRDIQKKRIAFKMHQSNGSKKNEIIITEWREKESRRSMSIFFYDFNE